MCKVHKSQNFPGLCPDPLWEPSEQALKSPWSKAQKFPIWAKRSKLEISGSHPEKYTMCISYPFFSEEVDFWSFQKVKIHSLMANIVVYWIKQEK